MFLRTCLKGCHFQRLTLSKVMEHLQHCLRKHLRQALGKRTERMPSPFAGASPRFRIAMSPAQPTFIATPEVRVACRREKTGGFGKILHLLITTTTELQKDFTATKLSIFPTRLFSSKCLACQVERAPTSSCIEDTCWEQQASQQRSRMRWLQGLSELLATTSLQNAC